MSIRISLYPYLYTCMRYTHRHLASLLLPPGREPRLRARAEEAEDEAGELEEAEGRQEGAGEAAV